MDNKTEKKSFNDEKRDSFADLMEEFEGKISEIEINDRVTGKIIEKKDDFVYLNLGGRLDGRMVTELFKTPGELTVGDEVEVFVKGVRDGFYICSFDSTDSDETGEESGNLPGFNEGSVVKGKISGHNKGGFEVKVGSVSCFTPFSKMDRGAGENPDEYVGKTLRFFVEEIDTEKNRYILNRKEIIRSEKDKRRKDFLDLLEKGKVYSGTVKSVKSYGAFIEVGEVEGLLHISDISHEKLDGVEEKLKVGDTVDVVLKQVDNDTGKISFSMKELYPDPWDEFLGKFSTGDKIEGKIETLKPYGAFVKIAPGISGLLHISKLGTGKFHKHPKEVFRVGDRTDVWIDGIDTEKRKVSLSGKSPEEDFSNQLKKINEETEKKGKSSSKNAFGEMLDKALKGKK